MRLLYLTATLPYSGGIEDFFIPELKELVKQGHEMLIVPRQLAGVVREAEREFLLAHSAMQPLLSVAMLPPLLGLSLGHPATMIGISRTVSRSRGVGTLMKNVAVVPKAMWVAKLALRWGATHIHSQWASTTATIGLIASQLTGIPWSFTAHRGDIVENNLLRKKCLSASFVRLISQSALSLAVDRGLRGLEAKSRVVHMGVALPGTTRDQAVGGHNSSVMLCAANLLPVKGHRYLLEAMARLKAKDRPCTLLLAGDGPLRTRLERQVQDLALGDRVRFLGHLPHGSLLSMYARGEVGVVVLPSVDLGHGVHEGIPVSLMEAMAYGIPVVSTLTGGIPELLAGGTGVLVPPADAGTLAVAMESLLTDHEQRAAVARAGRERVRHEFSAETAARRLAEMVQSDSW